MEGIIKLSLFIMNKLNVAVDPTYPLYVNLKHNYT